MPGQARSGLAYAEPLIFELGASGRSAVSLPPLDVPEVEPEKIYGSLARRHPASLPELSEPEVVRHYVRLSQANMAIDTAFYPLGSCTMKYNPKVNEWAARLPGFASLHPFTPDELAQGALELMYRLERSLAAIVGMDRVTLQPSAGAQGELCGLLMIRAFHLSQGRSPKKVLIPTTAHGTNAASCAQSGFQAVPFDAGPDGIIDPAQLARLVDDDVAALMVTNPNTLGLFERELPQIAAILHDKGALVYGDGANLNALLGRVRPGDLGIDLLQINLHKTFTTPHGGGGPGAGPVAVKRFLAPFLPTPTVEYDGERFYLDHNRPQSIGRLRSFYGNFGVMVRAYTYIREMGAKGLREASGLAVLNANYLRARLRQSWNLPYDRTCMHEVVIDDKHIRHTGVSTMDVAKRLLDHGFHAPTVYFPLVVKNAMLIEPTETESKATLDAFVEAMESIAKEAQSNPELLKEAPHLTALRRPDEARAARKPILRYKANG
ncbi:MAG: aminomethyl-transferring glycine dehydrogenase subunit GcvPB [Sandaracinaceae bacterium]|nr:aminomethyl-transferring glycine dehydrogenase subunit GcvPB [Sandaracinaceae bacterium]